MVSEGNHRQGDQLGGGGDNPRELPSVVMGGKGRMDLLEDWGKLSRDCYSWELREKGSMR